MKLLQVPYPKSAFKEFAGVMLLIGISVALILVVFQPFGTASFQIDYKELLLTGYGIVIFAVGLGYYVLLEILLSENIKKQWSVVHEVLFLFFNVLICIVGCYLYWGISFGSGIRLNQFVYFLISAASTAIFPVGAYLVFIFLKYKDVRHANLDIDNTQNGKGRLSISGSSKNEKFELSMDQLLYIKSNDNYVIINILQDDSQKKKMIRATLSNMTSQLGDEFLKCHRSYVVNNTKIIGIEGNVTNAKLNLEGTNDKIPVSRKFVESFRKKYGTI